MKKLTLLILLLVSLTAFKQTGSRTITGTVYDKQKQPLPGAMATIPNTSKGTTTNQQDTSNSSGEMMTTKFRYKKPDSSKSKLSQVVVMDQQLYYIRYNYKTD